MEFCDRIGITGRNFVIISGKNDEKLWKSRLRRREFCDKIVRTADRRIAQTGGKEDGAVKEENRQGFDKVETKSGQASFDHQGRKAGGEDGIHSEVCEGELHTYSGNQFCAAEAVSEYL